MLRKMFDASDHCPRQQHATTCNNMQQHATNDTQMLYVVG